MLMWAYCLSGSQKIIIQFRDFRHSSMRTVWKTFVKSCKYRSDQMNLGDSRISFQKDAIVFPLCTAANDYTNRRSWVRLCL